jgi:hypothetical protein
MSNIRTVIMRSAGFFSLAILAFASRSAGADTWRTEFQGTIYAVDAALAPTFQVGQVVTGSYTFKGTPTPAPSSGDVSYPMTSLEVVSPGYNVSVSASAAPYPGTVAFVNDRDYGNPLMDVDDIYLPSAAISGFAAPVNGLPAGSFVIRLERRGTPPIDMFQDGQIMYAPPNPSDATTLNYGYIQFQGYQEVFFRITSIQIAEIIADDSDGDGVPDVSDNCAATANPDQTDTDLDGQGNACDTDDDNDGVGDVADNCQFSANPDQADTDLDGQGDICDSDPDGDGVGGLTDNCPLVPNTDQTDTDGDGIGDDCDADDDNDSVCDASTSASGCASGPDNCPTVPNSNQDDLDADGVGDACDADLDNDGVGNGLDNCPVVANVGQNDTDGDGQGHNCDGDIDGDAVANGTDNCPYLVNADQKDMDLDGLGDVCDADLDGDGVPTAGDNCPATANSDQTDFDGDSSGDPCDTDVDGDGVANATDQCALTSVGTSVSPDSGCSTAQLCPCAGPVGTSTPWKNHGKYVSCVAHVASDFVAAGLISGATKDALVSVAGQSACGR